MILWGRREDNMEINKVDSFDFKKRLVSMLRVDFRRMFTMPLVYIMLGISLIIPILIFVMTQMMAGTENIDPVTNEVTIMEGFDHVWQSLGGLSTDGMSMSMDLVSMCNINMMFFAVAVIVCLFISADFRSGYAKNLFTVRSSKVDYVISKTLVSFVVGALMILAYFAGSLIGGAIVSLPFSLSELGLNMFNIILCVLSKVFVVLVFVPIFVVMSIVGKQRAWLSMILAFGVSMLLFTMIPMITPLDQTIFNFILCVVGGILFSIGLGIISNIVLKKTNIL